MQKDNVATDKKVLFGWAMYDFGNSAFTTLIVTFVYATYFTKAIAPDDIAGTALWSRGITFSAIIVAVLSPVLGAIADQGCYRKPFLAAFTAITVFCSAMLYTPLPGQVMRALVWFVLANIAFEMGMVFYNAFLPDIAPAGKIGRISGFGWGLGYIGGLAAMFLAMVAFVNPAVPWFGVSREVGQNIRATNLVAAAWFGVFSLPIFFLVKEKKKRMRANRGRNITGAYLELRKTFLEIRKYRQTVRFLLARLLYNDGLITVFSFGGIYAAGTFHFSFQDIMLFGIVLNIAAGIGAFALGFLDDYLGGKATILLSLIGLTIAAILAVFAQSRGLFWAAGVIVGILAGPNQSASRSLMGRFVPREKESQFFGFFAFSGKFTAFFGPFFVGLLTEVADSQRLGMSVVIVLFGAGLSLLVGVDEKEGIAAAGK